MKPFKIVADMVNAAGLSRIIHWKNNADAGTISAFRKYDDSICELYSFEEIEDMERNKNLELDKYTLNLKKNLNRDRRLRTEFKKLRDKIGYIKVDGMYQESGSEKPTFEISYFVFAKDPDFDLKKFLLEMGRKFNQDSITFAKAGKDYAMYCTTAQKYILDDGHKYRFGDKMATFKGSVWGGDDKSPEFDMYVFSRIRGKPFAWDNYTPHRVEACSFQSELTNLLNRRRFSSVSIIPGCRPYKTISEEAHKESLRKAREWRAKKKAELKANLGIK